MEKNNLTPEGYQEKVQREYAELVSAYNSKIRKSATGIKDVLYFLIENRDKRIWWWSWEFVGKTTSKGGYLSHRAPARASDLARHHTDLVEDRKIGRFCVYRLKLENKDKIKEFLGIN